MAKTKQSGSTGIEQTGQHPVSPFNPPHGYYTGQTTQGSTIATVAPEFVDGNRVPTVNSRGNEADTGQYEPQLVPYFFHKKAVLDIYKDMVWQQILSDSIGLPANSGTKIKGYRYLPLLDKRNLNDQGIDGGGFQVQDGNIYGSVSDPNGAADSIEFNRATGNGIGNEVPLGEFGGRVNRVGFSRVSYEGEIYKSGFFFEWSRDSVSFDSDAQLYQNMTKLSMEAANEIVENQTQRDIVSKAGTIIDGAALSYDLLMQMYDALYDKRVPEQTSIIAGSARTDTKVVGSGYFVYVSHSTVRKLENLKDNDGNKVWVGVEHYAYANPKTGKLESAQGEVGKIGPFRFIRVRNMNLPVKYNPTTKKIELQTGKDMMVVVGQDAVKGITLHTDKRGKGRYEIIVKKPGYKTADRHDPYGQTGFYSIQWWSGSISQRPERIVACYFNK